MRRRDARGFTLLEVLVAFVIAALALGVLFRGALDGLTSTRVATRYEEAVARARSHLAAATVTSLVPSDTEGDDGGGFHWHLRVTQMGRAEPQRLGNGPPRDPGVVLYGVTVAVSWKADGHTRAVELTTEALGAPPAAGGV
jgi:general secretion pathway protein I